jgi:hypothetical protein
LGVDTETALRIDHIRLKNPSRMVNGFRWFWTHGESPEGWLVLMNTGEVRLYDVDKRSADLQEQSPILSVPSPGDVETKLRLRSVRIRVGKKWRRIDFTGRERAAGAGRVSLAASTGGVFLEGLGELGDVFEWTTGGVERMRNTRRRRTARAAWKTLLSGKSDWSTVPANVEASDRGDAVALDADVGGVPRS